MHELSLCQSIAAIADRNRQQRRVARVGIQIGALRQAVPSTLAHCWTIITDGTELAGSHLDFEIVPVVIRCTACGAETRLDSLWLRCPHCNSGDVVVVHGEEFLVTHIDLVDQ